MCTQVKKTSHRIWENAGFMVPTDHSIYIKKEISA